MSNLRFFIILSQEVPPAITRVRPEAELAETSWNGHMKSWMLSPGNTVSGTSMILMFSGSTGVLSAVPLHPAARASTANTAERRRAYLIALKNTIDDAAC